MAVPRIPAGLKPIVAGYSYAGPGGAMNTQVAGGTARYALEYDRGVQRFSVALILTSKTQAAVWTAFFLQVIKKGTIAFTMPLDSGFGLADHEVNIVPETYQVSDVNGFTTSVAFTVEAESQAYRFNETSAQALIDLYGLYGDEMSQLLARLARFANVDTNILA